MWYATYAAGYNRSRLGMRHTATDLAVFIKHSPDGGIDVLRFVQVDDTLLTGTDKNMTREEREAKTFPSKGWKAIGFSPIEYNASRISKTADGYRLDKRSIRRHWTRISRTHQVASPQRVGNHRM